MAHDVFISYSSKDKPTADAVCATLEARGIRCWIAPRDILAGADWGAAIVEAIDGSTAMVLVFSSNANQSSQIKREVERAGAKGIAIIPFRIEEVLPSRSLEFYISIPHWLDAMTPPLERHLNQLAETLEVHLGKDPRHSQAAQPSPTQSINCLPASNDLPDHKLGTHQPQITMPSPISAVWHLVRSRPSKFMATTSAVLLLAALVTIGVAQAYRLRSGAEPRAPFLSDQRDGSDRVVAPDSVLREDRPSTFKNAGPEQPLRVNPVELRQARISELLGIAKANDSREKGLQAMAAVRELLKLDPHHADGLRLLEQIARHYGGRKFTNSIGMAFIEVKPGSFLMGSPTSESGREADATDETLHRVIITKPFLMGACEVTQAQWRQIMGTQPSRTSGDSLPVEQISWMQAVEFCRRLSQKENRHYRLPTEAEWEYTCRAGTTTPFGLGATINSGDANVDGKNSYAGGSRGTYLGRTTPVGSFRPNAWGFHDMHGNVWEWCSDVYAPYGNATVIDPTGPVEGADQVHRGGAWSRAIGFSRSASRGKYAADKSSSGIGLRCALDLPDAP